MKDWFTLIGPVLAAVVAVFGWLVGYRLNERRDQQIKRNELRIQHLIDAYRRLEAATKSGVAESTFDLQSALSDIRLFGSERQIALVNELVQSCSGETIARYEPLLRLLRHELRHELGMEAKIRNIWPFITPGTSLGKQTPLTRR